MSSTSLETKSARIIVCERTGRWATALRRELFEAGIRVWESRDFETCAAFLAESPNSFAILEVSKENIEEMLRFIRDWHADFPHFRFAVVADRSLAPYQWLIYETGATGFLCSVRKIGGLAETICHHLAQVPPLPQTLGERIWANLPWGAAR